MNEEKTRPGCDTAIDKNGSPYLPEIENELIQQIRKGHHSALMEAFGKLVDLYQVDANQFNEGYAAGQDDLFVHSNELANIAFEFYKKPIPLKTAAGLAHEFREYFKSKQSV